MQINLEINGVDFKPWLAENGIKYSPIERIRTSVITLDGTEHRKTVIKRQLEITLYDLPDSELALVQEAIDRSLPAVVNYTEKNGENRVGVLCYVSDPEVTAQKVVAGITYWGQTTFTIEER